ncbi:MAG: T9SS type A sorting domain-containing protein [Candidatus Cloacimonetes bacterium]|nr:T9SS type A sorting domain-containing protein [Candidatus Cloacimonadota bacterium]
MKKILIILIFLLLSLYLFPHYEITDDLWDLLLSFDITIPTGQIGFYGVEFDGTYFHATKWGGETQAYRFDVNGNFVNSYNIPIAGARDLTFDGTYLYASATDSYVICWEPDTGNAVPANNITVPGQTIRALAYDDSTDTFWSGNWGEPIVNWDRSGTIINILPGYDMLKSLAFDNSPEGAFIYVYTFDDGCIIHQIDVSTGLVVGTFDASIYHPITTPTPGGICAMKDWNPAYTTLGIMLIGSPDYIAVLELYQNLPTYQPPENLVATVVNYNDVHLEWIQPPTGGVLAHHSGYDNNGIGAGLTEWYCAARFDASDLADYYGSDLTTINVHIRSTYFTYVGIKVWEGGSVGNPGTEIYNEEITTSVLIEDWTNHILTAPIPLVEGNEYWLGYEIHMFGDCPCSVDAGPAVPEKGDWMYMYLLGWQEMSVAYGLDYNWCIEGVVGNGDNILCTNPTDKKRANMKVKTHHFRNMVSNGIPEVLTSHPRKKRIENNKESRILLGYKVYRDNVVIAEIGDPNTLTYDDEGLDAGDYEYYVTAIYVDPAGESDPSNIETATIYLPPPENAEGYYQPPNIMIIWDPPAGGRNLSYYRVYRDYILIGDYITSLFYIDVNPPSNWQVYYITAMYDGGYESGPSNYIINPINAEGNILPIKTKLLGNYPNPFNPTTTISYQLPENSEVTLIIYNIKGQKVKTLVNEVLPTGEHSTIWNGRDSDGNQVGSGIYFYKLRVGNYQKVKKMLLIK